MIDRVSPVRRLLMSLAVLLAAPLAGGLEPVAAAPGPSDALLADGWTADGFIDPASGESQRTQVALDHDGAPIAIWANRASNLVPYEIVQSRFDGTAWSIAERAFAPSELENQFPRMARAADGTLWAAWYAFDGHLSSASFADLLASRRVAGVWSAPEKVATGLAVPTAEMRSGFPSEFDVHAVSADEAWIVYSKGPSDNPFSLDRDLYSVHYVAGAGWGTETTVSAGGLAETRPDVVAGPGGRPVVFYGFANSPSALWASTWSGAAWQRGPADQLVSTAIFDHAAQPDTAGAARLVVTIRDETENGPEDRIREYTWDATGFHPGPIVYQAAVVKGGGNEPPDWRSLGLAASSLCAPCIPVALPPLYRVFWTDFSAGSPPRVLSSERTALGFDPLDVPGDAPVPADSYPNATYDATLERWYAVWTAPPSVTGRARAKFAWTQEFAGDVAIGGEFVAPDTARVTVVCSGDATGRDFRVYRLLWNDTGTNPPFAPPLPAGAVEIAGSPFSGPCPFTFDDVPPVGRWFYYVHLLGEGTFPEEYARSIQPIEVTGEEPPPVTPPATLSFAPYPQPAYGGTVAFPFDLASAASDVRIVVHDSRGRTVRRVELGAYAAGSYRNAGAPRWDGRDDEGRIVPAGVYWSRLWIDGAAVGEGRRVVFAP